MLGVELSGAPNENIVQNHLNIALLNVKKIVENCRWVPLNFECWNVKLKVMGYNLI